VNPVDKIRAKFEQRLDVKVEATDTAVTVSRRDAVGFPVTLECVDDGYLVFFDGWHERFDQEKDALSCFAFGLSDQCRLVTTYRGDLPVKWTVECREHDAWRADSTTGLLLVPFWRRRRIELRTNGLEATKTTEPAR
jgi:hypothetical protein